MPSLDVINQMEPAAFSALFGSVYEHSPWIAERAFAQRAQRPFGTATELSLCLYGVVRDASSAEQLALIRSHPELAGRQAQQGTLTAESANEQRQAGLDALTPEAFAQLGELNKQYRERFDMPFIICARQNSREAIFGTLRARLHNSIEQELQIALAQIGEIARLRIADLLNTR